MTDGLFDFEELLTPFLPAGGEAVAVAVSGGPDSMALCHMLSVYSKGPVHALSVDHGLRPEAAAEAAEAGRRVSGWDGVTHRILVIHRDDGVPQSRIQEEARHARYALLADYCADHEIGRLFTAHHQDDQAETFLFRLAKGSGLDGLAGMRVVNAYSDGLEIVRPLLSVPKQALVDYCHLHDISFALDPSNDKEMFARVRLRRSYDVLAAEGLTPKRLAVTARRMARARDALDFYTDKVMDVAVRERGADRIVLALNAWREAPEEIRVRLLLRVAGLLTGGQDYGPRRERLEDLAARIYSEAGFKKATLGGVVFGLNAKNGVLCIEKEDGKS